MSKPVVVVTAADLAPQALEILGSCDVRFLGKTPSEEDIVNACTDYQPAAIIVRYGTISKRAMLASSKLRVVAKHGAGTDTIDKKAAAELGIEVNAAAGANADAVAEHSWALILGCAKGVVKLDARMRAGHWDKATHKSFELHGKTLGVVGLGAIGQRVARLGVAFGMEVLAFDPFTKEVPTGVMLTSLAAVLSQSHVVSLNCPLTEDNRHMINREAIASMRDGVILVNTGRGGLVDDAALIEALRSGKLRGAGLDAFTPEPLVGEHHYRDVPNTILSPHVGGVSEDAYVNMGIAAANNVIGVLRRAG
ncbi:3-phosphoglycerate dehydrogenase [Betaproteobacteria bacterium GR16-43]|nr:3-phosphoglycerate dehydrogenase [Betaproteobacteria bacterium GR16-43]